MTIPVTTVLGEGDDALHYDVHGDLASATPERPALLAFANPMDASAFTALAAELDDRVVVTLDPRGAGRNPTGTGPMTAAQHADDLRRVVESLAVGPVDAFGSSGGAICLLALLEAHPELVRRAVVHEPPLADVLPDGGLVIAAGAAIRETYDLAGQGPAMAAFVQLVIEGEPLTAAYLERPAPDPAAFGMSAEDDGDRTDPLMRNMPGVLEHRPDYAALTGLGDRLCVAVGDESGQEVAARGAHGLAERLGRPVTTFPSHHAGFVSADFQPPGDPAAFAARLREVLG